MRRIMKKSDNKVFLNLVLTLALPVALQSMLQASFGIIDQIMIGQLGSVSVAGVGLAAKFASIFNVIVSAVSGIAGIMIAQYIGQENKPEVRRSFNVNLGLTLIIALIFTFVCVCFPEFIMGLYTEDVATIAEAASYLRIFVLTFLPLAAATIISTVFRCMEKARLPLYASIFSAVLNTVLNYILIFGRFGAPKMGVKGAAIASVAAQCVNFLIMFVVLVSRDNVIKKDKSISYSDIGSFNTVQYLAMLSPALFSETMWSLGENVYAMIYGHMGTDSMAAMTLINPIQGLLIGALSGLASAAAIIIGKRLGAGDYDDAYNSGKKLIKYGFIASVILSIVVLLTAGLYVRIYNVSDEVKSITVSILFVFAIVAPVKVINMILGGGIIRSGGKTQYVMMIDLIGTWCFGVPLGLLSSRVLKLSIPYVYFILSLEECVRMIIGLVVMKKRVWMNRLEAGNNIDGN